MSENNNFKRYIDEFFENIVLYNDELNNHHYKDLLKASIDVFLEYSNEYTAIDVYETFLSIYQISTLDKTTEPLNVRVLAKPNNSLELVKIMFKYEKLCKEMRQNISIHSVYVFLLGLAIYSQSLSYRVAFSNYIKKSKYDKYYRLNDGQLSDEEFLYRWGIASLFHDIALPVEHLIKPMRALLNEELNTILTTKGESIKLDFSNLKNLDSISTIKNGFAVKYRSNYPETKFLDLFKPTDILVHKLSLDFNLNSKQQELLKHKIYQIHSGDCPCEDNGIKDHGIIASIVILDLYGYLIQKYEKDYSFFFYPIVDSATAILLHTLYNVMQIDFGQKKLDPNRNPISYLLILCDELQEWNRKAMNIKDRQHSFVNNMEIEINDDYLYIDYINENDYEGLSFNYDKERLLNHLLNIHGIFRKGLTVNIKVNLDLDNPMIIPTETEIPYIPFKNVDRIAKEIHNVYKNLEKENGIYVPSYDELESIYKKSLFRQAKSYTYKLNIIGCEIVPKTDHRDVHSLTDDEIEQLAKLEHEDWCNVKSNTGWISHHDARNPTIMGKENVITEEEYLQFCEYNKGEFERKSWITPMCKDAKRRIHSILVDWEELNEVPKEKDRYSIRQIPQILSNLGFKIVKTRLRLLTIEMYKSSQQYLDSPIPEFNQLATGIRHSYIKQTVSLIKILSKEGYKIVSIDADGKPILSFNNDEIELFSIKEHEKWYEEKMKLGWKYSSEIDENNFKKCSPNLLPGGYLNPEVKKVNRKTIKLLPELCDKAGLKIIKIEKH